MKNNIDPHNEPETAKEESQKNNGILPIIDKEHPIRKQKEFKVVLEFFVKTMYVNLGLN
ncbi:MAG: hypothetical protein VW378_06380 [bacterium]